MLQFVLFILWVRVTFKLEFAHVKLQESVHKQMFLTFRVYKCVFSLLPDDYCVGVFVESTTHPSHGVLPDQQDDLKRAITNTASLPAAVSLGFEPPPAWPTLYVADINNDSVQHSEGFLFAFLLRVDLA